MARKTSAKAPTKKKTVVKKKAPAKKKPAAKKKVVVNDVDQEDFDFDGVDTEKRERKPTKKKASKKAAFDLASNVGKAVSFSDDEGITITGTLSDEESPTEGCVVVETEDDLFDVLPQNITFIDLDDEEEEDPKPKSKAKPKAKKKAEPKAKAKEEEEDIDDLLGELDDDDVDEEEAEDDEEEAEETDDVDEEEAEDDEDPTEEPPMELEFRILNCSDIKQPRDKPRKVDKKTSTYKLMLQDIEKRGVRVPIQVVGSWEKPILENGLRRLSIQSDLGRDLIPAVLVSQSTDKISRLYNGTLDNEIVEEMHWSDLGATFKKLIDSKEHDQKSIAKAFGYSESALSRMIGGLKLPKAIIDISKSSDCKYSSGVFMEMVGAPKSVLGEIEETMKAGRKLVINDVRNMVQQSKSKSSPDSPEEPETKKKKSTKPAAKSHTYQDISRDSLLEGMGVRVHSDKVTLTLDIDWKLKTFKKFDIMKEIKALFDESFAHEETTVTSFKSLGDALTDTKSELGK